MNQVHMGHLTWQEVENYLKGNRRILIPIGSTEQHGPTGLLGTDYLCAESIALEAGRKSGTLVAPTIAYGMASHHMAFAGSVTMRPSVYQAMLCEIIRSYYHHGFRDFRFINGHGGNEPSVRSAFQEVKHEGLEGAQLYLYNWWKLPKVTELAEKLYGKMEGMHATPSEVSLTFHIDQLPPRPYTYEERFIPNYWPMTAKEVRTVFSDGTMKSDPGLACEEHGKQFQDLAVQAICTEMDFQSQNKL